MKDIRKKIFDILQIGDRSNLISRAFDLFLVSNIMINITAMVLGTFECFSDWTPLLKAAEYLTTAFFCVEYVLRIWTADYLYPDRGVLGARLRFLRSFDGIVDLLTIIPSFFLTGFVAFRMLRVVRIFHLFRLNAQYDSFNVITSVLYEKRNQIASSVFIICVLMLAGSLCMYSVEHDYQPEVFANAFSGIWWSVSTILTVGYGDIYPVTIVGQCMAIVIAFLGVGVVAIPTGIISAGFVEQYTKDKNAGMTYEDVREIAEIRVDEAHPFDGRTIEDIASDYNMKIHLVLRGDMSIVATRGLKIRKGDILILERS